jgi:hypothetical protein
MSDLHEGGGKPLNPNEERIKQKVTEARQELSTMSNIPSGYVEFRPSTKGLISCPASMHIRNLSTEDLLNLGLAEQEDLPVRIIKMLDSIIYEDVSVADFHEKEVIELLLYIYESFYTDVFPNLDWTLTDEDWEFLAQRCGGRDTDEFAKQERAYKNGTVKPKFDVSLADGVDYYEIDENIRTKARVNKTDGYSALFGLPKYGDVSTLKYFVERMWKEEDKKFASITDTIKFRRECEDKLSKGENVDIRRIPTVPKAEMEKFKEYELEKSVFAMTAVKAQHLLEVNGQDISMMPLEKKMDFARDPHLDHSTFQQVQDHFSKLKFGIKEEITVRDPILDKVVKRKYSFQLTDLLQAIRDKGSSDTTISFE